MKGFNILDLLFALRRNTPVREVQLDCTFGRGEKLGLEPLPLLAESLRHFPHYLLHHSQVLKVVVGLEQCDPCVKFH